MSAKRRALVPLRKRVRLFVLTRDGFRCQYPGCKEPAVHVHEILSRAQGGSPTDPTNCVSLCRFCHIERVHGDQEQAAKLGLLHSKKWSD